MIIKGSRRGEGMQMALHLLNERDNDHVTVHEIRGFVADTLPAAITEAYAISRGTRYKKFLYSMSLNPPETEFVPVELFESTIDRIGKVLGFSNQPRVIVFHEKEGRRHAHCVWSRIDMQDMKAIDPSHDKLKLKAISRDIYLEQGWKMPRGLVRSEERNPLNSTYIEYLQAKRKGVDPKFIKETIHECWAVSDSRAAFCSVLEERGYYLAKGDKRGHVVVDWRGDIFAVSRMLGLKAKQVSQKLGNLDNLPSVSETTARINKNFSNRLKNYSDEIS